MTQFFHERFITPDKDGEPALFVQTLFISPHKVHLLLRTMLLSEVALDQIHRDLTRFHPKSRPHESRFLILVCEQYRSFLSVLQESAFSYQVRWNSERRNQLLI